MAVITASQPSRKNTEDIGRPIPQHRMSKTTWVSVKLSYQDLMNFFMIKNLNLLYLLVGRIKIKDINRCDFIILVNSKVD